MSKNGKILGYFVVALGLGLTANAEAANNYPTQNYPQSTDSRVGSYTDGRVDTSTIADKELAKQVQDKISSGWFSKRNRNVVAKVLNGRVTLAGEVNTADDKAKIEEEVRNLKGVISLDSQITIRDINSEQPKQKFPQDKSSSLIDDQLNKKIRDSISSGWLWTNYKDITLNTTNGIVTLEGTIKNPNDQQKVINEIKKIDGVKGVRSNLRTLK